MSCSHHAVVADSNFLNWRYPKDFCYKILRLCSLWPECLFSIPESGILSVYICFWYFHIYVNPKFDSNPAFEWWFSWSKFSSNTWEHWWFQQMRRMRQLRALKLLPQPFSIPPAEALTVPSSTVWHLFCVRVFQNEKESMHHRYECPTKPPLVSGSHRPPPTKLRLPFPRHHQRPCRLPPLRTPSPLYRSPLVRRRLWGKGAPPFYCCWGGHQNGPSVITSQEAKCSELCIQSTLQ